MSQHTTLLTQTRDALLALRLANENAPALSTWQKRSNEKADAVLADLEARLLQAEAASVRTDAAIGRYVACFNETYCHNRRAGVAGGAAEIAAMRAVLSMFEQDPEPRKTS